MHIDTSSSRMAYDLSRPISGDNGWMKKCLPTLDFLLTRLVPFVKPADYFTGYWSHTLCCAPSDTLSRDQCYWERAAQVVCCDKPSRFHFGQVCAHRLSTSCQTSLTQDWTVADWIKMFLHWPNLFHAGQLFLKITSYFIWNLQTDLR